MVQVPSATSAAVVPETVHTDVVLEVNVTGKFELAVALTVIGEADKSWLGNAAKLIV
jgi:hypothetical protein